MMFPFLDGQCFSTPEDHYQEPQQAKTLQKTNELPREGEGYGGKDCDGKHEVCNLDRVDDDSGDEDGDDEDGDCE